MELNKETGNTLGNEVYTISKAIPKDLYNDTREQWSQIATQLSGPTMPSLELSYPAELFNKHEILQVSSKGKIIQPIYTREYFNHPTFSQTLQLIPAS